MRKSIVLALILLFSASGFQSHAQAPQQAAPAKPAFDAVKAAEDWVKRFNALDDWYITTDGKESPELKQVVDSMMELYAPDVLAEVPPHDPDQIGPVMLRGSANVRKWVERIATTRVRFIYLHKRQTGDRGEFEGERLVYTTPLPWGGVGMSFQIIATYSLREDRRRFTAPGVVILQFGDDGKIHRLRLFEAEVNEVVPL
jgi:hypothetical protein